MNTAHADIGERVLVGWRAFGMGAGAVRWKLQRVFDGWMASEKAETWLDERARLGERVRVTTHLVYPHGGTVPSDGAAVGGDVGAAEGGGA